MKTISLILAISLLSFTLISAQVKTIEANTPHVTLEVEDGVLLVQWETEREINTSYFIIERSVSSDTNFETIARVKAGGYAHHPSHYTYEDILDTNLVYAYKVTLVLMDGMRISATSIEKTNLPNPVKSNVIVAE